MYIVNFFNSQWNFMVFSNKKKLISGLQKYSIFIIDLIRPILIILVIFTFIWTIEPISKESLKLVMEAWWSILHLSTVHIHINTIADNHGKNSFIKKSKENNDCDNRDYEECHQWSNVTKSTSDSVCLFEDVFKANP